MKKIGLIRVLTTDDPDLLTFHGKMIERLYPSLKVTSRCIPGHPKGVYDDATERSAVPLVVRLAAAFEEEGFDAVIVSCAGDPGVREARKHLRIPVVGAGEATAAVALATGERVGVLGITDRVPKRMRELLGPAMVCSAKPPGVNTTLDLMTQEGRQAVEEAVRGMKEEGVTVVALACTGLSTIGAADWISAKTGLRVIDPVRAEGLIALYVTTRVNTACRDSPAGLLISPVDRGARL